MEDNITKFCPECGCRNDINDDFCSECGYSFKSRVEAEPIEEEQFKAAPMKKKRKGVFVGIVVGIGVIASAVGGLYLYLGMNRNKTEVSDLIPAPDVQATPIELAAAESVSQTKEPVLFTKEPDLQTEEPVLAAEEPTPYVMSDYEEEDIRDQYILPNSDTEIINAKALQHLSAPELELARNEIYARHGRAFKTGYIQQYFNNRPWYKINPNYNYDNEEGILNDFEKKNIQIIVAEENKRGEN